MKIATIAIASALTLGSVAQAQWYGDGYDHGGYGTGRCGYYGCDQGYGRSGGNGVAVGVACAPEVLEGNVAATDRTLATLAATPEFASATAFKAQLKKISAVKAPEARAAAYFKLIGVDSSNKDQVVEFVGAREVKASQLAELERATQLSGHQADQVASSLQKALRGNLQ